jgi:hypothetical protein
MFGFNQNHTPVAAAGLVGRMYVFADGKKRLGFSASMVEQFQAAMPN